MTLLILRYLHLLFMGSWMGLTVFLPGDVRRTLATDGADLALLDQRVSRTGRAAAVMGLGTFFSGVAMIVSLGGMGAVPVPIHIGLTLTLVMIGLGVLVNRAWSGAYTGLKAGDKAAGEAARKRIAMLSGIFQLLWMVILGLMVFRNHLM
jgi:hypothetical protein